MSRTFPPPLTERSVNYTICDITLNKKRNEIKISNHRAGANAKADAMFGRLAFFVCERGESCESCEKTPHMMGKNIPVYNYTKYKFCIKRGGKTAKRGVFNAFAADVAWLLPWSVAQKSDYGMADKPRKKREKNKKCSQLSASHRPTYRKDPPPRETCFAWHLS